MNTNETEKDTGQPHEGLSHQLPRALGAPAPTHDLLVMSHGPDANNDDRSNHACLNSFARSSWIISAGG